MKLTIKLSLLTLIFFSIGCSPKSETNWKVFSPDSAVCMELCLCPDGSLCYRVSMDKDTLINCSTLGIERKDADFSKELDFVKADSMKAIDEVYKMKTGKKAVCKVHSNEAVISFKNEKGNPIDIIVRVANDGVAFKYRFPETDTTLYTIVKEYTEFAVADGKAWMASYGNPKPCYESYYKNGIATGTPSENKEDWAFPMLFDVNDKWMLITEANTSEKNNSTHVKIDSSNNSYQIAFPSAEEANKMGTTEATSALPWESSWRVIEVGKTLASIFESTLVTDVCDPAIGGDFSWVAPGRAGWSWWSAPNSPKEFKAQKEYIDFAKEMGWEYVLVDANWDIMEGGKVEDVIKYANEKNVGIILWYNSGGPINTVTERPRDLMFDATIRDAEFKRIYELGVKGVKVDFFESDKQICMEQYIGIMKSAAKYQITVNFHGCTIPKGWSRTYPNLIGMEGVRGTETYLYDTAYPSMAPVINCIYPFTRNAVGSMDYTPVAFTEKALAHKTTYAHELALSVVFENGITHFADQISAYKNLPVAPKQFLKDVPAAWTDSKLIDGYPGKYIVVARKKNTDWYVAGINGENLKKEITVKLDFLAAGKYTASIIQDGKNAKSFISEEKKVTADDSLKINILPLGGFAIQIKR